MESEQQNSLSFLDVLVCRCNNSFGTSVYRKESFTGVGTSFFSYRQFNFKINYKNARSPSVPYMLKQPASPQRIQFSFELFHQQWLSL